MLWWYRKGRNAGYSGGLLDGALREISVLGVNGAEKDLLGRWKPESPELLAGLAKGSPCATGRDCREAGGEMADGVHPGGAGLVDSFGTGRPRSRRSSERAGAPAAKLPQVKDRKSLYVIVELPGAIFRLHRSGAKGCWMGRRREFRNSQKFLPISPNTPT